MKTEHKIIYSDSKHMTKLDDQSTDLVVTSPPYPMIEMWDGIFARQDTEVEKQLKKGNGFGTFEQMHKLLDQIWKEVYRILKPGGFACINIGDATRTIKEHFCLYPNHSRILAFAMELGFSPLPCILWRKQTNAPNKFMGSGMLPAGAYVTLEHEYILILRKEGKREFKRPEDKVKRRESALFWEERNTWFSDVWFDIKGSRQALGDKQSRKRSGAFPFELVYRLINMYSVKGDLVVDPFMGMGTTALAAMVAGRNSVGYEIDPRLEKINRAVKDRLLAYSGPVIDQRLSNHLAFVAQRTEEKGPLKHQNEPYGFSVMTAQEKVLIINTPIKVDDGDDNTIQVTYNESAQEAYCNTGSTSCNSGGSDKAVRPGKKISSDGQMSLF